MRRLHASSKILMALALSLITVAVLWYGPSGASASTATASMLQAAAIKSGATQVSPPWSGSGTVDSTTSRSYGFYAKRGARIEATLTVTSWPADPKPFIAAAMSGPRSATQTTVLDVGGITRTVPSSGNSKTLKADAVYEGWHYVDVSLVGARIGSCSYRLSITVSSSGGSGGSTTTTAPSGPRVFSDVAPTHPYHEAIATMYQKRIISGYSTEGLPVFRPDNKVTRAQFAKMICGALGIEVTENMTSPFTDLGPDLPADLFPHEYIAAAYAAGFTTGKTASTYAPASNISRAQLLTMVVRALTGLAPDVLLLTPPSSFKCTVRNLDSTHGPNVRVAQFNNLLEGIVGIDGNWSAQTAATRGETAQILWRAMGKL